ncbi:MAG: Sir2 family NAD-dependent protein deacetylase [Polyangiaceae bacterium]
MTAPLHLERYRRVVVLTGAGISVASGLPTFRGPGGLWEREDGPGARGLDAKHLAEDPAGVWRFCAELRAQIRAAAPNPAHLALAAAEAAMPTDATWTVITQNVDGLHQRAGSRRVIELHGALERTRCTSAACETEPFVDASESLDLPLCRACGAPLRADVVLFDEEIPGGAEWHAKRALRECDLFVAIGTSGTVSPASNFVRAAEFARARTVIVNLTPMSPRNPAYDEEILGRAEDLLPELFQLPSTSP